MHIGLVVRAWVIELVTLDPDGNWPLSSLLIKLLKQHLRNVSLLLVESFHGRLDLLH